MENIDSCGVYMQYQDHESLSMLSYTQASIKSRTYVFALKKRQWSLDLNCQLLFLRLFCLVCAYRILKRTRLSQVQAEPFTLC